MKITWHGHSCMELSSNGASIVFDPFAPGYVPGLAPVSASANMVLCSHQHGDHNYAQGVTIIEHSSLPFKITPVPTYHDDNNGLDRGENTVYVVETPEGLRAVHLGDLGHIPSEEQIKKIGTPDVLMIPVGGYYTIDAETAKQVCGMLNPRVIIPMHYKSRTFGFDVLSTVSDFTRLFPAECVIGYDTNTIEITKETPSQIAVLRYI